MGLQWVIYNATVVVLCDYKGPLYTVVFESTLEYDVVSKGH